MKNKYLVLAITALIISINCMAQADSEPETVTDADGNVYHTVNIGTQTWTVENLRTTRYNDGTIIPQVQDSTVWNSLSTPAAFFYQMLENGAVKNKEIQVVYNGFAVNTEKLAPKGWHIPDYYDWITLAENTGGEYESGGKLVNDKSIGFNAEASLTLMYGHPSGYNGAYWWSSTAVSDQHNVYFNISSTSMLYCNYQDAKSGFAIRLVKDSGSDVKTHETHSMNGGVSKTGTVTDVDGNTYKTVSIGTQEWMAENLKTTKYRNGDLIETSKKPTTDLTKVENPKYHWAYDANESNAAIYGRLYTWFAATDSRNIAPVGWHVPSKWEWQLMKFYLQANGFQNDTSDWLGKGSFAKSLSATTNWNSSTKKGSVGNTDFPEKRNTTGFTALPGGYRFNLGDNKFGPGAFVAMGSFAYWWSSSEYKLEYKSGNKTVIDVDKAYHNYLSSDQSGVVEDKSSKKDGFSVRCIRD